jgi:hypothetical protein
MKQKKMIEADPRVEKSWQDSDGVWVMLKADFTTQDGGQTIHAETWREAFYELTETVPSTKVENQPGYYLRPSTLAALVADLTDCKGNPAPAALRAHALLWLVSHVGEKEAAAMVAKEDTSE